MPGDRLKLTSGGQPAPFKEGRLKDVEILMLSPMMPLVVEALESSFTLHRAWAQPNPDAYLGEVGPRIRGLAAGGAKVNAALFDRLPKLELVANFGVGYDSVDAAEAARRG